jgi:hypothetical protein
VFHLTLHFDRLPGQFCRLLERLAGHYIEHWPRVAQVTSRLYEHVWEQWCTDTRQLLEALPAALARAGPPPQAVGQTLERWLLLLKVRSALQLWT